MNQTDCDDVLGTLKISQQTTARSPREMRHRLCPTERSPVTASLDCGQSPTFARSRTTSLELVRSSRLSRGMSKNRKLLRRATRRSPPNRYETERNQALPHRDTRYATERCRDWACDAASPVYRPPRFPVLSPPRVIPWLASPPAHHRRRPQGRVLGPNICYTFTRRSCGSWSSTIQNQCLRQRHHRHRHRLQTNDLAAAAWRAPAQVKMTCRLPSPIDYRHRHRA